MKRLFMLTTVVCIILINVTSGYSTPQYWAKSYGGSDNEINCLQSTSDGNYVLAGTKNLTSGHEDDFWVFKLDNAGNMLWEKTYGTYQAERAYSIQQTIDGGYVVAGSYNGVAILILKLDSIGDIIWQKTYGFSDAVEISYVQQTSDGGYIILGSIQVSTDMWMDIFVMKLENNGNVTWAKTYRGTLVDAFDYPESILETAEGNYIIVGTTASFVANGDALVLKLAPNGDIIWQKTYGSFHGDTALSVVQMIDGGFVIACIEGIGTPGTRTDLWLLKLDNDGNILWQKVYEREYRVHLSSFQKTMDGGFIGAGLTDSDEDTNTWIIKLDGNGNVIWDRAFEGIVLGDYAGSLQITSDAGYIVAGGILFSDNSKNTLVLRLDNNGSIPECDMFESGSVIVSDTTSSGTESALSMASVSYSVTDSNFIPQDTATEASIICCYDSEDNDFDCIPEEEDNCSNSYNSNQLDTYPPQGNNIGDACDCECDFDCSGGVDANDVTAFLVDFGRSTFNNPCTNANPCNGDVNCDGNCDATDVDKFLEDFGRSRFNNPCPACVEGDWCGGGNICQSIDDCSFFYTFCSKPTGQCDGEGICTPIPISCPFMPDPVCGCDGNTYINSCDARWWRQSIDYWGACVE